MRSRSASAASRVLYREYNLKSVRVFLLRGRLDEFRLFLLIMSTSGAGIKKRVCNGGYAGALQREVVKTVLAGGDLNGSAHFGQVAIFFYKLRELEGFVLP